MLFNMKEYKVLNGVGDKELAKAVNEALKDGWTLVGGVAATSIQSQPGQGYALLFQAVAK